MMTGTALQPLTVSPLRHDGSMRSSTALPEGTGAQGTARNLGAIFTKGWVANLILDLAGYTSDVDLAAARLIEPACGQGAFLVPIIERLVQSCRDHGRDMEQTGGAIVALDVDAHAVADSRQAVVDTLTRNRVTPTVATALAEKWVNQGDFLQLAHGTGLGEAQWVVGNPPYVRVEDVDRADLATYRRLWPTMSGRADLYVGFLEAGLSLLSKEGRLAVICADRWMRNQYGASLRRLVQDAYAVECCVVMHEADAFEERVAAYPAITVFRAGKQEHAMVVDTRSSFAEAAAARLMEVWRAGPAPVREDPDFAVSWTPGWFRGDTSWPSASPDRLSAVGALEAKFPTLSEAGITVGVGVATGADKIYLVDTPGRIEESRLLPIVGAKETSNGQVVWAGRHLINPWGDDGLVALEDYPAMAAYLRHHKQRLMKRHVAQKAPQTWWRTLDRVQLTLAQTPKLLIPDLKDRIHPVLDNGTFYPSHSLYYITAPEWDLRVLGGLLMSDLANLFVEAYSVRMANGYLRVSAQYLRRVRIPHYKTIDRKTRRALASAFDARDSTSADQAAAVAYGLARS